ncbi:uncharacterized protein Fot_06477 [Forsythia ovata]|uniref:Uncharacterized protein n=1 Tax=Forsythia ovata TaxID=205694 RepID=A0ABD1WW17_9LAMI
MSVLADHYCQATWAGEGKYQVIHVARQIVAVDLNSKTFVYVENGSYEAFLVNMPCLSFYEKQDEIIDYVDPIYKKDKFMKVYSPVISPMNSTDTWESRRQLPLEPHFITKKTSRPLEPHFITKKASRPQKVRRRDPYGAHRGSTLKRIRFSLKMTSKQCNETCHNKRSYNRRATTDSSGKRQ